jgi:hypothetical protein
MTPKAPNRAPVIARRGWRSRVDLTVRHASANGCYLGHQRTFPTAGRMGEIDPQLLRHSRDPQGARGFDPLWSLPRITAYAADTRFQTLTPIGSDGSAGRGLRRIFRRHTVPRLPDPNSVTTGLRPGSRVVSVSVKIALLPFQRVERVARSLRPSRAAIRFGISPFTASGHRVAVTKGRLSALRPAAPAPSAQIRKMIGIPTGYARRYPA